MNYNPNEHCYSLAQYGVWFPLNEYRARWKMVNQPLAHRLLDNGHSQDELQQLIPNMIMASLSGYTILCPYMPGPDIMVAPVLEFESKRKVHVSLGSWKVNEGSIIHFKYKFFNYENYIFDNLLILFTPCNLHASC